MKCLTSYIVFLFAVLLSIAITPTLAYAEQQLVSGNTTTVVFEVADDDGYVRVVPSADGYDEFVIDKTKTGIKYTFPAHTALTCYFESDDNGAYSSAERENALYYDPLFSHYRDFTLLPGDMVINVSFKEPMESPKTRISPTYILTAGGISSYLPAFASSSLQPQKGDTYSFSGRVTINSQSSGGGVRSASMTVSSPSDFAGTFSSDCYDHGAAASGGSCTGTITVRDVNKETGEVRVEILAEHIAGLPMHWITGSWANGLPGDYQRFVSYATFHFEYNGYLKVQKSSANPTFTNNNKNYSLAGAIYTVYKDSACTQVETTLTTNASGVTPTVELPSGTYYVKETKAPEGYRLDPNKYTADVSGTTTANPKTVKSEDEPECGRVSVKKVGTNDIVFGQYATYDRSGAEYEVKDENGKVWTTLVTDRWGKATSMDLPLGTYTLTEKVPPKSGYAINITPFKIKVEHDKSLNEGTHIDREETHTDPKLGAKLDFDGYNTNHNSGKNPQGGGSLAEAVYELKYYDGYYNTPSQVASLQPKKTSTAKTAIVNGETVLNVTPANQEQVAGDYGLPLGTYTLQEIQAPEGYHLDPTVHMFQCRKNQTKIDLFLTRDANGYMGMTQLNPAQAIGENNRLITAEQNKRGDVSLMKYIEVTTDVDQYPDKKRPAAGVQFEIINDNDYDVMNVETGKWCKKGEVVYTLTTDEQGYATTRRQTTDKGQVGIKNNYDQRNQSPNALAFGKYHFREVPSTTPDGYKPIENFAFSIDENYAHKTFTFENKTGTTVRITKADMETGKTVTGYTKVRILDENKNIMTFDEPYPSNGKYSVLTTDREGSLVIPQKLLKGTYYIEEVEAPDNYLHSSELVSFEVDSSTVNDYDHPMDVKFPDAAAMGKISITNKDADTLGVITSSSATYEIRAAEDIVTNDGTVRLKKDDIADTVTTVNGIATSKSLYIGKYYAIETIAPDGYLVNNERLDCEIKYEGDKKGETDKLAYTYVDSIDKSVRGAISVTKTDADSHNAIKYAGVTFDVIAAENITGGDGYVWHAKGEKVATLTTDEHGNASTDNTLHLGKYEVIETSAPYGYVLDSTPQLVELKYADQNTAVVSAHVDMIDERSEGDFAIVKLDRETGSTVFTPGCEIDVYANEDIRTLDGSVHYIKDAHVGSVKTDETGKVTSQLNLPVGKYRLQESNAPYGYVLDGVRQYEVEITWDGGLNGHNIYEASISDMPAKGVITFTKADAETGKTIPMAGIKAQVIAAEDIYTGDNTLRTKAGTVVAELTTDENGYAQTGALYLGKYQVKETFAPEGYLLNETPVDVEIVYGGQDVPVVMQASQITDENAKGIIEIVKIDKETGKVVQLPDATFEVRAKTDIITGDGTVRASAGELVDTVTTDSTGKGSTKELYLGVYTITETVAPHGYTLDTTPHDAVIAYKNQHTPIVLATESIANTVQKGVISVTKVDTESGLTVLKSGAVFEVKAVEDIVTPDDTRRVSAGEVVDTIETDDSGVASTKALYLGRYEVRETQAPEGYLLTDEVKSVELVYGAQTESLVYEMESVADQAVKGTITIHKEDSDLDEPLPNVEYEIRAAEDIVTGDGIVHHKKGDVIETIVTDENGTATSDELYLGEYVVVETKQPNGYELDTKEYPVHLRYADQVTPLVHEDITLYNTPSSISVKKVSTADAELVVPDTKFVGWSVADELTDAGTFAVFADDSVKIESVSVDYMGELKTTGTYVVERSFEFSQKSGDGYQVFSSDEELVQGDYILHVKYVMSDKTVENDIPFVVNEYDKNAFFAIGDIVMSGDDANKFELPATVFDDVNNGSGDADDNTTNDNVNGEPAMVLTDNENDADVDADTDEDASDKGETDGADDSDDNTQQETSDVDESKPSAPVDNGNVKRVPAVLMNGKFSYAVTDENGIATFKYVPQGKVAFAEYEPAEGYVSDRTPGYVEMTVEGAAGDIEVSGNISKSDEKDADGNIVLDMTFADDQTKLHISKKDITTSEELPGNTLSVYEYAGDGSSDTVENDDYGKLIETWVSTDEPHYMELLPQGTYILKEEQAVDGYTIAESIIFRLNDTGVEQHVLMNNEHEAAVADEFIEMVETADFFPMALASVVVVMMSAGGVIWYRRQQQKA